jgi:hypothetical protein
LRPVQDQPQLFPDQPPKRRKMARRPNVNPPEPIRYVVTFKPEEAARFKVYPPGGGGLQQLVTWYFRNIDPVTLSCSLTDRLFERTVRYIRSYGKGSPNQILRDSCIPALRRIGIVVEANSAVPRKRRNNPK